MTSTTFVSLSYYLFIFVDIWRVCFFFFSSRRRHTRCSRDWSSDVCSSDLRLRREDRGVDLGCRRVDQPYGALECPAQLVDHGRVERRARRHHQLPAARDREGQQAVLFEVFRREALGERACRGGAQVGGRAGWLGGPGSRHHHLRRRSGRWLGRGGGGGGGTGGGATGQARHGRRGGGKLSRARFMPGNCPRSPRSNEAACSSLYTTY